MTTVLAKNDLLRFRLHEGTLDREFAMLFPLNRFLQGRLGQRMEKSGLSSLMGNILLPLPIKLSFPNRQSEFAK